MLTKRQLRELHPEDVPLHVLELDYVESVMLKWIYSKTDVLVFKGGTCLRKAHGLNRFSEDLDFALASKGTPGEQVKRSLQQGLNGLEKSGMRATIKEWQERPSVFLCRITYKGPLFTGQATTRGTLEVEASKLAPFKPPEWRTVTTAYPDTGTYSIQCMDPSEMLAEKLRTMLQRRKPRDLYDAWFLMKKGIKTDLEMVNLKMKEVELEPVESIRQVIEAYHVNLKEWERDLGPLIGRVPEMEWIKGEVRKMGRENP
jgi:predicted nucleotidyltransferase component of viral defense system